MAAASSKPTYPRAVGVRSVPGLVFHVPNTFDTTNRTFRAECVQVKPGRWGNAIGDNPRRDPHVQSLRVSETSSLGR